MIRNRTSPNSIFEPYNLLFVCLHFLMYLIRQCDCKIGSRNSSLLCDVEARIPLQKEIEPEESSDRITYQQCVMPTSGSTPRTDWAKGQLGVSFHHGFPCRQHQ